LFKSVGDVLRRNPDVLVVTLVLILIGMYLGATASPQEVVEVIETLKEAMENVPKDWFSQMAFILACNSILAFFTWVSGVVVVGTPYFSIKSIGYPVGLFVNSQSPYWEPTKILLGLTSFAVMEIIAMIFVVVAGLLIVKNIYLRFLFKRQAFVKRTFKEGLTLFVYSICTLTVSAAIEASLILAPSPSFLMLMAVLGTAITSIYLYMLLRLLIVI
jgi:uncharacterized membrane protein SpoIIM required for sporulation